MAKNRDSRYGLLRDTLWMIRQARESRRAVVPIVTFLCAVLATAMNGINVLFAPNVLRCIEDGGTLAQLVGTVLKLAIPLILFSGLSEYLKQGTFFEKVDVRLHILRSLNRHQAMTSYPNTEDTVLLKKVETAVHATQGNDQATEALWERLEKLLTDILCFALYLFLLRNTQSWLLLLITATTVAEHFVNRRINEWGWRHRDEAAAYGKKMDYVSQKAEDSALGKDVRIFGMKTWLTDVYRRTLRLYDAFLKKREGVYLWTNVIDVMLTLLRNGFAYYWFLKMALYEGLSASQFLLYFSAATGFTQWVAGIMDEVTAMQKQSLEISSVREIFDTPEVFRFEDGMPLPEARDGLYELKMENVSFRYPGAQEDALKNIDLTISPGEKLALVGLNGAGKTTLVKLLCGLYDPTQGRVLLNGTDIREFNRREYYKLFAAVFQQSGVIDATLAENTAQTMEANAGYDEKRVYACLDKAQLADRVKKMPDQLHTHIGRTVFEDGIELSGGETQRLLLARALYKDAPILLLDEPTAALDPIAESTVYDRYSEMSQGKTSVFISHRLASTRFCDRIILLQSGHIAEEGTHDALLAAGGQYAELFQVQRQYYQEERKNEEK